MAVGRKGVASSEDYFADHFPGFPVVPGVVQVEALAQLSGKLIQLSMYREDERWVWPILSMVRKAKFRRFVGPGDTLVLKSKIQEIRPESAICTVEATVDGQRASQAELLFVFNPGQLNTITAQAKLEEYIVGNIRMLWAGFPAYLAEIEAGRG